jgi:hypothetical protein
VIDSLLDNFDCVNKRKAPPVSQGGFLVSSCPSGFPEGLSCEQFLLDADSRSDQSIGGQVAGISRGERGRSSREASVLSRAGQGGVVAITRQRGGAFSQRPSDITEATGVDDHATEPRLKRTSSVLEHGEPATDLTERVVLGIANVEPEELTAVVVRIIVERSPRDVGADLLDSLLIHIGVEDVSRLVGSLLVSKVGNPTIAVGCRDLHIRIDLRERAIGIGIAGNLKVNEVIEPTIATIHTKGSNKLRRSGIADVVTQSIVVTEQGSARLSGGDKTQNRRAVLTAKRIVSSTITDQTNANNIKEVLRQHIGGSRSGDNRPIVRIVKPVVSSDRTNGRRARGVVFREGTSHHLRHNAEILRPAAVIKNRAGKLSQLLHSLAHLTLNLERGLEIVQADARSLVLLGLEVPSDVALPEGEARRIQNASSISSSNRGAPRIASTNGIPVIFKRARKDTFNRKLTESRSHAEGELTNASETTPRGLNRVPLLDVNAKPSGLPFKEIVHGRASNRSRCCHNDN